MIHKYCRAYLLKDVRQFSAWIENQLETYADDDICYVWDDFTVVRNPIFDQDNEVIFDTITADWRDFCQKTLQFEIPEDLRYAYEENASL